MEINYLNVLNIILKYEKLKIANICQTIYIMRLKDKKHFWHQLNESLLLFFVFYFFRGENVRVFTKQTPDKRKTIVYEYDNELQENNSEN